MTKTVETIIVLVSAAAMLISALLFLDARHASQKDNLELKSELLDQDIRKDSEARYYYSEKITEGSASPADVRRHSYLEDSLDRKYEEQRLIQDRLLD